VTASVLERPLDTNRMNTHSQPRLSPRGWMDSIAVGMSTLCAIHCLVTPLLLIILPNLTTTFWAREDFHLWMLLLVLPTTATAVFLGCREHKDKAVLVASAAGLCLLFGTAIYETFFREEAHCPICAANSDSALLVGHVVANLFGGGLLASAHIRNFWLCRSARCEHDHT